MNLYNIMRYFLKTLGCLILFLAFLSPATATATPTQYGDSGLISVPTTDISSRGVFQTSVWFNYSKKNENSFTLLPISLSMGVLDGLELSGSYPNLLLNTQNDGSMRGFENLGLKYRFAGSLESKGKAALSAFVRQTISDNKDLNGLKDLGSRLILSYDFVKANIHFNIGYLKVDSPTAVNYKDETLFGGGIDFRISYKFRPFVEVDGNTKRDGGSSRIELTPGLQYFPLPYLSMVAGLGYGMTDVGPDYRFLVGLTFSSGEERYVKAIPVIPGSREKYAAMKSAPMEDLLADIPDLTKEIAPVPVPAPPVVAPPSVPAEPVLKSAPVQPAPPPLPIVETEEKGVKKKTITLGEVQNLTFDFNKWELKPDAEKVLDQVAEIIKSAEAGITVILEAHTDNIGSAANNMKVSYERANSVKNYLVNKHGIDSKIVSVKGHGATKPVASNSTAEGRQQNRRVEVIISYPKAK